MKAIKTQKFTPSRKRYCKAALAEKNENNYYCKGYWLRDAEQERARMLRNLRLLLSPDDVSDSKGMRRHHLKYYLIWRKSYRGSLEEARDEKYVMPLPG